MITSPNTWITIELPDRSRIIVVVHLADLQATFRRALNTWPDIPKEIRALSDALETEAKSFK